MNAATIECQPREDITRQQVVDLLKLQGEFNAATGIQVVKREALNRSFNPIFDRWHIQQAWKKPAEVSLEKEKKDIRDNIRTNLMERMFAVETYGKFEIDDSGYLRSEFFKDEPFGQVLLRGVNWRKANGSKEQAREGELGELAGWQIINDTLVQGDVGTKIVSLSPPGMIDDTSYDGRYVDIFEKVADYKGKPHVTRLRYAVDYDDEKYHDIAQALQDGFWEGFTTDGRPLDAWYLSHPIVTTGKLPDWILPKTAMSISEFTEKVYAPIQASGLIEHYLELIQSEKIDWREVAKTFNTILTVADKLKDGMSLLEIQAETMPISVSSRRGIAQDLQRHERLTNPALLVGALGMKHVKQVGGGGCPANRGFDFTEEMSRDPFSVETIMEEVFGANSVGKFGDGGPDGKGPLKFKCDGCGGDNTRPLNDYKLECDHCHKKFTPC